MFNVFPKKVIKIGTFTVWISGAQTWEMVKDWKIPGASTGTSRWIVLLPKIGVDGCGKEACATLACHLMECKLSPVPSAHSQAHAEFKEALKRGVIQAGLEGSPTALIVANINLKQVSTFDLCYLLTFAV